MPHSPTVLSARPWVAGPALGLDLAGRRLVAPPDVRRPVRAMYQRFGRDWLALARPDAATLALVTRAGRLDLPGARASAVWVKRRVLWAELRVESATGALTFAYRRPRHAMGGGLDDNIDDLAFWTAWRLDDSGLDDWLRDADWALGSPTGMLARGAPTYLA